MSSGARLPFGHLALDTSAYSHLRRRHTLVVDWIAASDLVCLSVTVLGELEAAFRQGSRYEENASALADFLQESYVQVQEVTQRVARRYGQLFAALRRAGTPIPTNDIWIAASAIEAGAHLVTFDTDFQRIDGLACTVLK